MTHAGAFETDPTATAVLLRARKVAFGYGAGPDDSADWALRDISLEVRAGDRVGLLGASGSGKSTLLHLLAGLRKPQRGTLDVGAVSDRLASLVFQFPERQLFSETVREDVAYGLRQSGIAASEVEARVAAALDEVGLSSAEFGSRPPFHLSGGEMRRVALAGALAQHRPVVLLDEPTLGLDAEGVGRLRDLLERMHARSVAYWMASHAADFVAAVCDRVVVLDAGTIAFDGSPAEFWGDPERAARLGIEMPHAATWAAHLRTCGIEVGSLPDDEKLADLLGRVFPGR